MRNFQSEYDVLIKKQEDINKDIQLEIIKLCKQHPDIIVYNSKVYNVTLGKFIVKCPEVLSQKTIPQNLKTLNDIIKRLYQK